MKRDLGWMFFLVAALVYVSSTFAADEKLDIQTWVNNGVSYTVTNSPSLDLEFFAEFNSELLREALNALMKQSKNNQLSIANLIQGNFNEGNGKAKFSYEQQEYRVSHSGMITKPTRIDINAMKLEKLVSRKALSKEERTAKLRALLSTPGSYSLEDLDVVETWEMITIQRSAK